MKRPFVVLVIIYHMGRIDATTRLPIARRARNLPNEDFNRDFSETSTPVVIEGIASDWRAMRWSNDVLEEMCGNSSLHTCQVCMMM